MKYKVALREKKLKKEDLSKKLQGQIDKLERFNSELAGLGRDKKAESKPLLTEMDNEIVTGIKKFDPAVQQKRLASIGKINSEKKTKRPPVVQPPEVQPQPDLQPEQEFQENGKLLFKAEPQSESESLLDGGIVKENPENLQHETAGAKVIQFQPEQHDEIRDFEKTRTVEPRARKRVLGFFFIAAGVAFITGGMVILKHN